MPLKGEWRANGPEELVRQQFVLRLHSVLGFDLAQMDQERRVRSGRKSPKADIVVWASAQAKADGRSPVIVVEAKSDHVTIVADDYDQGESYARATGAEFMVAHNNKETRVFRLTPGLPGTREDLEALPKATDLGDARRMEVIRRATKAFTRDEFKRLLFEAHSILRDNHKLDPGRAFDEISKILFIKMFVERTGDHEKFTVQYLDEYARIRRRNLEEVMDDLFEDTKHHYNADDLFGADDRMNISFATFRRIVSKLERFNLGSTAEDVKGLAFESFLGQTFRGELGQFFTPRPIVDFMVALADPREGDVVCDPASGSGGFLIRSFEHVRVAIEADIQERKTAARAEVEASAETEDEAAELLNTRFAELNADLDVAVVGSRLWRVAHDGIYGTDAEARAARTSKMNMIMHGDGHGGIHHHDGLIDTNGIFPGRFDLILTNPPFGATVGDDQRVGDAPETRVSVDAGQRAAYSATFGAGYDAAYARISTAETNRQQLLTLFDLGRKPDGSAKPSVKSEVLFLERSLDLACPGGRVAIVVPDGVLNNPSLEFLRNFIEERAQILAVVSIPDKTFRSAKTQVKASVLYLRRFTEDEALQRRETAEAAARAERERSQAERDSLDVESRVTYRQYARAAAGEAATASAVELTKRLGVDLSEASLREAQKGMKARLRELNGAPQVAGRAAVRTTHDYPVFMATAEHVGIRGSGRPDPLNELPAIIEAWRTFSDAPTGLTEDVTSPIFRIDHSRMDRWDPPSFRPIVWDCDPDLLVPIGEVLSKRTDPVDRETFDFDELTPITIHFDGSVDPRDVSDSDDYTMDLFNAAVGDIVVSKIDLKNGAVGIVPEGMTRVVVTNHFVVYEPNLDRLHPPYLSRLIQTNFFKDYLWRKKVGSEGRKEVKIEVFEATLIPLPDVDTQQAIVAEWAALDREHAAVKERLKAAQATLDARMIKAAIEVPLA